MRKWVLLIALLVSQGVQAAGVYYNGNLLLAKCEGEAEYQLLCVGYIKGVSDTSDGKSWEGYPYCIGGVITGQLQKIVIKYMNEHPEDLHLAAYALVQNAFLAAFPCE